MLDRLLKSDWRLTSPEIAFRPILKDDDEIDWKYVSAERFDEIRMVFGTQDRLGRTTGIWLESGDGAHDASFIFRPRSLQIQIAWGPNCPRHPTQARLVDGSWILTKLKSVSESLNLRVEQLELAYSNPW